MRRLKDELKNGYRASAMLAWCFGEPFLPLILKNAGFDCMFIDMEHSCFSYETVQAMVQACRSCGLAPFVRAPKADKEPLQKIWDMGAVGVVMPMVESSEQAREFVRLSKYPPEGKRGMGPGLGHTDFRTDVDLGGYMRQANEQLILLVQPETRTGAEKIEEILDVQGIDGIFTGPYDLSASMGIPGRFEDEGFKRAYEKSVATAVSKGKLVVGFCGNHEQAVKLSEMGAHIIIRDTDQSMLFNGAKISSDEIGKLKGFGK